MNLRQCERFFMNSFGIFEILCQLQSDDKTDENLNSTASHLEQNIVLLTTQSQYPASNWQPTYTQRSLGNSNETTKANHTIQTNLPNRTLHAIENNPGDVVQMNLRKSDSNETQMLPILECVFSQFASDDNKNISNTTHTHTH